MNGGRPTVALDVRDELRAAVRAQVQECPGVEYDEIELAREIDEFGKAGAGLGYIPLEHVDA